MVRAPRKDELRDGYVIGAPCDEPHDFGEDDPRRVMELRFS
ncbi:hypothetical protein [Polyangium spumosum]|nr:hypothetical protein [Polyangium spumosum]